MSHAHHAAQPSVTRQALAGLGDPLFWRGLALGLVIAFAAAFPVNRWLIARGRGHAVVHGAHG